MVSEREAYRLLGLTSDATPAQVRTAFRRKVREQHPDTALPGGDDSTVQELVDAYHLLATASGGSGSGPGAGAGGDKGSGRDRIRVSHGRTEEPTHHKRVERRCPACAGSGVLTRNHTCPDCRGSARVTTLDLNRARVSWCPSCRGMGLRRVVERCQVCEGTGTTSDRVGR